MIPVTYSYQCSCGNYHTHQEIMQHGSHLRLLVNPSATCPECKRQLQATVVVTYAPLDTTPAEKPQQLTALFREWQQGDEQEQRETSQALVDAGVIDLDEKQQ